MRKMTMDLQNGDLKKREIERKSKKPSDPDKKRRRKRVFVILILLLVGICGFTLYRAQSFLEIMGFDTNPVATLGNILQNKEPELKKDRSNRTNVLIVGIDTRPSQPGLMNTDTIIVASFNHTTRESVLISIPRDLWVSYPDNEYYFTKINGIYNYCEGQEEGSGMECLVQSAETVTDLDIHYHGMINIQGLVEVIDLLGGVDVEIERSFTDYMFPSPDNTYVTVSFEEGLQHMDGEEAMQYARSRHAAGPEGSDFARARRQQRLILAVKEKILSTETFTNPLTVLNIIQELGESITLSDITTEDVRAAVALANEADNNKTYSVVLDPSIGNWSIITEDPSAAYVLVPEAGPGEWEDLHAFLTLLIKSPAFYTSNPTVYVYDGGLGYNETYLLFQELIEEYPYHKLIFGGASAHIVESGTEVFNFTEEDTPTAALEEFSRYFDTEWTSDTPEGIINPYGEDISIIIGPNDMADELTEEPSSALE